MVLSYRRMAFYIIPVQVVFLRRLWVSPETAVLVLRAQLALDELHEGGAVDDVGEAQHDTAPLVVTDRNHFLDVAL